MEQNIVHHKSEKKFNDISRHLKREEDCNGHIDSFNLLADSGYHKTAGSKT